LGKKRKATEVNKSALFMYMKDQASLDVSLLPNVNKYQCTVEL